MRNFKDFNELNSFLLELGEASTMNIARLDGYLRALAITDVSWRAKWYHSIFDDNEDIIAHIASSVVQSQIETLFRLHCDQAERGECSLPFEAVYTASHEDRQELEQWARGFMQGYIVQEEYWNGVLTQAEGTLDDLFDLNLSVISTVADAKFAVETGTDPSQLADIFASLPERIVSWGAMSKSCSVDCSC